VIHAAALKQVPGCEYNPFEAMKTNVEGTQNVIDAAIEANVGRVLLISTDKAVNPCSVMGATKLLAEKLITSANNWSSATIFSCVRMGNVTGSRGSLLPTIRKRVAAHQPIYLTDSRMRRYVISPEEVAEFCLTAIEYAGPGEVWIPNMKERLVSEIIGDELDRLGSNEPIVTTGLRPGEKLVEELMTAEEGARAIRHEHYSVIPPLRSSSTWHLSSMTRDCKTQLTQLDDLRPANSRSCE
jgi:FlaA1/EpsC-like NDP-sugar epimerase